MNYIDTVLNSEDGGALIMVPATAFGREYTIIVEGSSDADERYDRVVAYYHGKAVEALFQCGLSPETLGDIVVGYPSIGRLPHDCYPNGLMVPMTTAERRDFSEELGDEPYRYFSLRFREGAWDGEPFTAQEFRDGSLKGIHRLPA
jgi:hypothetical protein